jgi:hypothetical protein
MGAIKHHVHLGEHMITNEEKIDVVNNRLENLEFIMNSFIDHAEEFKDKYSLEEELLKCNSRKNALLQELSALEALI